MPLDVIKKNTSPKYTGRQNIWSWQNHCNASDKCFYIGSSCSYTLARLPAFLKYLPSPNLLELHCKQYLKINHFNKIFHPPSNDYICTILFHGSTALVGQGLHIFEVQRLHSDTPHSMGLFQKTDQQDAGASTSQLTRHSQKTEIHAAGGNRNRSTSK